MLTDTLRRIDVQVGRINTHPEYSQCVSHEVRAALGNDAARHSIEIELLSEEGKGKPCKNNGMSEERKRQLVMENESRLNQCWRELGKYGLTLTTLNGLGHILEPTVHPHRNFRDTHVLFGQFEGSPPGVVLNHVDNFLWSLENSKLHPVCRAAEAHLGLVAIHPYADGNGRIARLIQNFCLAQISYPPAIIPVCDKGLYLYLLGDSLTERADNISKIYQPGKSDERFHEFIASKVLASAEHLESALQTRRIYDVELTHCRDAGIVYSVANRVRGLARGGRSDGIHVTVDKSNGGRKGSNIKVIGDISTDELRSIFDSSSKKYGFNYRLTPRTGCVNHSAQIHK